MNEGRRTELYNMGKEGRGSLTDRPISERSPDSFLSKFLDFFLQNYDIAATSLRAHSFSFCLPLLLHVMLYGVALARTRPFNLEF